MAEHSTGMMYGEYLQVKNETLDWKLYIPNPLTHKKEKENDNNNYGQMNVQLDKILDGQRLMSEQLGSETVHDEHLFIVTHQGKGCFIYLTKRSWISTINQILSNSLRVVVQADSVRIGLGSRNVF